MKVLFINANLHGHINPTLALVKKLTERGNSVKYFCSKAFYPQVTAAGAEWIGYSENLNRFLGEYRPTDRHPFYMLMEYMLSYDRAALPEILKIAVGEAFDMIICDSYFGGACFLKQLTVTPVVCSHSSFAMSHAPVPPRMLEPGFHPQLDNCLRILSIICKDYNINEPSLEQVFTSMGELNIVYTTRAFNGDDGICEPKYLFSGPSVDRLCEKSGIDYTITAGKKIIYISLGSVNTDFLDFYKLCITAFRNTDYYVFMSIGVKCDISQLGNIPSNFTAKDFLPQLEILNRADVFITHAGFNSVNESLYFGVPMLALPMVNDQQMVAKRLTSMNLGVAGSIKDLSAEELLAKTTEISENGQIKQNCMRISHEMRNCGDIESTAEKLEEYVKNQRGVK